MSSWTDSVESKAAIIHSQIAAARVLAEKHGGRVDEVSARYFALLRTLYEDEFPFARMADASDLVARFQGPSVDLEQPPVTIVGYVFRELRDQIRSIAKSIAGLTSDHRLRWPSELDPQLAGLARGSLLVGLKVPRPTDENQTGQILLPEVSEQVFNSVRSAVRSLSLIAKHVREDSVDDAIREEFPDPAIRDTVMVAASKLAPTGKRGINSVVFYGPEPEQMEPRPLTSRSRAVLTQALARPVKVKSSGIFEGTVREIDLDARRFEIRGVTNAGAIRCVYENRWDRLVREILDARVTVSGSYETVGNQVPRLIQVGSIELVKPAPQQEKIDFS
jgi:hypothetical protein